MNNACVRCNRPLKDAESINRGMGPVCFGKAAANEGCLELEDQPVLNGYGSLRDVGLVCRRREDGTIACNVPHVVKYHSPTGYEIGFSGSGPADLALNVLHLLLPPKRDLTAFDAGFSDSNMRGVRVSADAVNLHQQFKDKFIATMPKDGGRVPIEQINEWIAQQLVMEAA